MRFALSVLPLFAAFACSTPQSAAPVMQAAPDASVRVGPGHFENPDCMWEYIDEVRAIEDEYTAWWQQERAGFVAWYQDANASGASPEELAEIRAEADRVKAMLFDEFYGVLAEFEADVCGEPDPCQDPNDPQCCPYVGPDGQCYDDYCSAYPDDPDCQVWCDNPNDPDCFCEYDPTHPDCPDCDINGDGVCDECDRDPQGCEPCEDRNGDGVCDDYCDLNPQDPDCWQGCDFPGDPACFCEYEPDHPDCQPVDPCDPATGEDCCDPNDPDCGEPVDPPCDPNDPDCGQPVEPPCDPATGDLCCDDANDPDCNY